MVSPNDAKTNSSPEFGMGGGMLLKFHDWVASYTVIFSDDVPRFFHLVHRPDFSRSPTLH